MSKNGSGDRFPQWSRKDSRSQKRKVKEMAKIKVMTDKGYQILQNIVDSEYNGDHAVDVPVWTFSVTKGLGRAAGGTIAGLHHMGAVSIGKVDNIKTIAITATGLDMLAEHNARLAEAAASPVEA